MSYEKGYLLLNHLELKEFKKTSIRTDNWKNYPYRYFSKKIEVTYFLCI